jgi:hypothetical protein
MTKEDFQHIGKHFQSINGVKYPDQVLEKTDHLVKALVNNASHEEGEKWKEVDRARPDHGREIVTKHHMPWHALRAVEKEASTKTKAN